MNLIPEYGTYYTTSLVPGNILCCCCISRSCGSEHWKRGAGVPRWTFLLLRYQRTQ